MEMQHLNIQTDPLILFNIKLGYMFIIEIQGYTTLIDHYTQSNCTLEIQNL